MIIYVSTCKSFWHRYTSRSPSRTRISYGDETYYRPLGGSIELGEKSAHTVIREFQEELHAEVEITNYLGCLENIFHLDGEIGHEIIQLYSLRLLDTSLYEMEILNI